MPDLNQAQIPRRSVVVIEFRRYASFWPLPALDGLTGCEACFDPPPDTIGIESGRLLFVAKALPGNPAAVDVVLAHAMGHVDVELLNELEAPVRSERIRFLMQRPRQAARKLDHATLEAIQIWAMQQV